MLQEAKEQEAEEANDDAYITEEANKIGEDNNDMIMSMEEEQKNLEYQETMKVYIENISKNKKTTREPIYEGIHDPFLKKQIFSLQNIEKNVKIIKKNLSYYHLKSK